MKGVQCYELLGRIALKNHAFYHFFQLAVLTLTGEIRYIRQILFIFSIDIVQKLYGMAFCC